MCPYCKGTRLAPLHTPPYPYFRLMRCMGCQKIVVQLREKP